MRRVVRARIDVDSSRIDGNAENACLAVTVISVFRKATSIIVCRLHNYNYNEYENINMRRRRLRMLALQPNTNNNITRY